MRCNAAGCRWQLHSQPCIPECRYHVVLTVSMGCGCRLLLAGHRRNLFQPHNQRDQRVLTGPHWTTLPLSEASRAVQRHHDTSSLPLHENLAKRTSCLFEIYSLASLCMMVGSQRGPSGCLTGSCSGSTGNELEPQHPWWGQHPWHGCSQHVVHSMGLRQLSSESLGHWAFQGRFDIFGLFLLVFFWLICSFKNYTSISDREVAC